MHQVIELTMSRSRLTVVHVSAIRLETRSGAPSMPATVKIAELKAHLSELVAKAEAGEEVVIMRGHRPVARLAPLEEAERARAALDEMLALRDSGSIRPVTRAEIRAWIDEGRA